MIAKTSPTLKKGVGVPLGLIWMSRTSNPQWNWWGKGYFYAW